MIDSLSSPHNRHLTLTLLVLGCLCAVGVAVAGSSGNELLGSALALLGSAALAAAFTHAWRSARKFRLLMVVSIVAFAALGTSFELLAPGGELGPAGTVRHGVAIAVFLVAVLACPAVLGVALLGIGALRLHAHWLEANGSPFVVTAWYGHQRPIRRGTLVDLSRGLRHGRDLRGHHDLMLNGHGLVIRRRKGHPRR